ncbi:hypothetical protein ACQKWADRAFT_101718 [Trichoderma austrokoningii]
MSWSTAVLHTGPATACTHTRSPGPQRGESEGVDSKRSALCSSSKVHEAKIQGILGFNGALKTMHGQCMRNQVRSYGYYSAISPRLAHQTRLKSTQGRPPVELS